MTICQKCQHKWSWKEGIKNAYTFKMKMKCPHCGGNQYMSAKARKKAINFTMVLQLIWLLPVFLGAPTILQAVAICFALILCVILTPFLLELSNEEEPLW